MITIKVGDLFETDKDVLVNTINCVGVMGKGIALAFKKKYPKMFQDYKEACERKEIKPGTLYPYYENDKVVILNFPTKNHWRAKTKLEYVTSGLDWFVDNYENLKIKSIAFPALGCGNGGLSWDVVAPIMYDKLKDLPIDIDIYAPIGTDDKKLNIENLTNKNNKKPKLHNNRFLALRVIQCLSNKKNYSIINDTTFKIVFYLLERFGSSVGIDDSDSYNNTINLLLENGVLNVNEDKTYSLHRFNINEYVFLDKEQENANKVYKLLKDINSLDDSKVIVSILFAYDNIKKEHRLITENMILNYMIDNNADYSNKSNELMIREFCRYLNEEKLVKLDYSRGFKEGLFALL